MLDRVILLYNAMAVPLVMYASMGHELIFGHRYEFLPLMLISVYSAVSIVASWLAFMLVFLLS